MMLIDTIISVAKKIFSPMPDDIRFQYEAMYNNLQIKPERVKEVKYVADKITQNRNRYAAVANEFNGMPWWFVGVIHQMEGAGNFSKHLHNGDPLTARTVNVPKGRPKGNPPFRWEDSAIDALKFTGKDKVADWTTGNCLKILEEYNGTGYRKRKVPSPYLWSFSQFYEKGKYVSDKKYDPNKVSLQPGVACIMKMLGV